MKKKAIVIGAGPGGLICANNLVKEMDVILVEQHHHVRGRAQGWTKPMKVNGERIKASFETTHALVGLMPGQVFYDLLKNVDLDMEEIGGVQNYNKLAKLVTPNGDSLELALNLEDARERCRVGVHRYVRHKSSPCCSSSASSLQPRPSSPAPRPSPSAT